MFFRNAGIPVYRVSGLFGDIDRDPARGAWAPAVDVEQNEKAVVIRADLPGVHPDKMKVAIEDGRLTLEGEREETRKGEEGSAGWTERFTGTFRREIALGSTVDAGAIEAKYEDGVLTITCPVKAEAQHPVTALRSSEWYMSR